VLQADAAPLPASANGRFSLQPGYWGYWGQIRPVQAFGAPQLILRPSRFPGFAVPAWPVEATRHVIQQSLEMTSSSWTYVPI
jgi:hypothetical protein